jgi:hypothetical protein
MPALSDTPCGTGFSWSCGGERGRGEDAKSWSETEKVQDTRNRLLSTTEENQRVGKSTTSGYSALAQHIGGFAHGGGEHEARGEGDAGCREISRGGVGEEEGCGEEDVGEEREGDEGEVDWDDGGEERVRSEE